MEKKIRRIAKVGDKKVNTQVEKWRARSAEFPRPEMRQPRDHSQRKQVRDGNEMLLSDRDDIMERWKGYHENHLNEENPSVVFGGGVQIRGVKEGISTGKNKHCGKGVIKRRDQMRYLWKCKDVWEATGFVCWREDAGNLQKKEKNWMKIKELRVRL